MGIDAQATVHHHGYALCVRRNVRRLTVCVGEPHGANPLTGCEEAYAVVGIQCHHQIDGAHQSGDALKTSEARGTIVLACVRTVPRQCALLTQDTSA